MKHEIHHRKRGAIDSMTVLDTVDVLDAFVVFDVFEVFDVFACACPLCLRVFV